MWGGFLLAVRNLWSVDKISKLVRPCPMDVMFLRQILPRVGPGWQAKKMYVIKNHNNSIASGTLLGWFLSLSAFIYYQPNRGRKSCHLANCYSGMNYFFT